MEVNDSNFADNFSFVIGKTANAEWVAHRPVEPAFLVTEHSQEAALEAALDIISGYIREFVLQHKESDRLVETGNVSLVNPKSYDVVLPELAHAVG